MEALTFAFRASSIVTGKKTATAAVLLMKPEMKAMETIKTPATRQVERPASRKIASAAKFRAPVFCRAAARTNMAATVTVAGLLNPAMP